MLRTTLRTLAFSSLNQSALQDGSTCLRYLLRAISYRAIESAYAVQPVLPGSRAGVALPSGHLVPAGQLGPVRTGL